MPHHVIIGNGVAGTKAASAIRNADAGADITILSADEQPFYFRPKLADYVSGKTPGPALTARKPEFYKQNKLGLRLGARVTAVDTVKQRISLSDGSSVAYDRLLIASGGRPTPAGFRGAGLEGLVYLKSFADAEALRQRLTRARKAIVIGESLLGLEMARACRQAGLDVEYLVRRERFWPEILDDDAATLVEQRLADSQVSLRPGTTISEVLGSDGAVRYVVTGTGDHLPCDLVGVGLGLEPDVDWLKGSGIAVDMGPAGGVVVDEYLAANTPNVFAAGDAAKQSGGLDYGWLRAWEQGALAGANMAGSRKRYTRVPVLSIQAFGLDLMAIGQSNPAGPEFRRLSSDPGQIGVYKRLSLKGDSIVGALLVGDVSDASAVEKAVRDKSSIGQVDPTLTKRLFDPYFWDASSQELLCPVCKFGMKLGTEAKADDVVTCPICGEEFVLVTTGGRLTAKRVLP